MFVKRLPFYGAALALAGCTTFSAISGNTSACGQAEQQLNDARTALVGAQLVLSNAQVLSPSSPAVGAAQKVVDLISADISSIQALVNTKCSVTLTPSTGFRLAARAPVITLDDAKRIAKADLRMTKALAAHAK